jgi:uncharacterized membrane protein YjjB (DUF3815 family)
MKGVQALWIGLILAGAIGMLLSMVFPQSVSQQVGIVSAAVVVACFGVLISKDMKARNQPPDEPRL